MNQTQREFLIGQVNRTVDSQIETLKEKMPTEPSLNNYLIAAFLDNSIEFADMEKLKVKMREKVLKLGPSDQLITDAEDSWSSRRRRRRTPTSPSVNVAAEDLFIIPEAYKKAKEEYDREKAVIDKEIEKLQTTANTVIMKIQIGSAGALDKLVMQIDSIGDLNLMNNQLMLGDGKK